MNQKQVIKNMARNFNQVTLLGNVTADPELRYTGGGTAVTNFSLATNESYKDASGNWVERAQFHNLTAWGRLAEIINEYVRKGTQLFVQGSLSYGKFTNKDGVEVKTTEVKVRDMVITSGSSAGKSAKHDDDHDDEPGAPAGDDFEPGDDLPF